MARHGRRPPADDLEVALTAIGRAIATVRTARHVTVAGLAEASGVSGGAISKIEHGRLPGVTVATLAAVCDPLDIRLELVPSGPLLRGLHERSDFVHARCAEAVIEELRSAGWEVREEVPIGDGQGLGFVDILAFHPRRRILLIVEVKTQLRDIGGMLRTLAWYGREAPRVVAPFGWSPNGVAIALVALASDEVRTAATHATVRREFPTSLSDWLRAPEADARMLGVIDPLGLPGMRWCGVDDELPYLDYRHAATVLAVS